MRTYYAIFNGGVSVTLEADGYAMEEDKVVFYAEGRPIERIFAADLFMIDQALEPEKPTLSELRFGEVPTSIERVRENSTLSDTVDSF